MAAVPHVTSDNFADEVLQSPDRVLVDFYSTMCPPCRALAPYLDQLSDEFAGCIKIVKVNVDEEPALAVRFGISAVPTLIWFDEGRVVERTLGADPAALRRKLSRLCLA
ncbi:MAG: thioredoxin family protein [Planctomycetaceae bacterium]